MTTQAPNWFETKYVKGRNHVLQSEGFLTRGMTTETDDIRGEKAVFHVQGRGDATQHPSGHSIVPLMNTGQTAVEATIADYDADDAFKARDIEKMSESQQLAIQQAGAMAIGREYDKLFWREIVNATNVDGGAAQSLVNPAFTLSSKAAITGKQRSMGDLFCAVPDILMETWKGYEAFSKSDWKGPADIAKHTTAITWGGVHYFTMEDEFFTSFAPAAGQLYLPMWHKKCVGRVMNGTKFEGIFYRPDYKDWRVNQKLSGVCKIIQNDGVRLIRGLFPTSVVWP